MPAQAGRSRAARPGRGRASRAGSWRRRRARRADGRAAPRPRVERRERLVQHQQPGLVQKCAAEREPLRHAARVRGNALGADLPEAEALEQHPDPLAALRHSIEAPVEVEVLERGQVSIEERLVTDEAEPAADASTSSSPPVGAASPATSRSSVVLPGPVRASDNEEATALELEVDRLQRAAAAVPLLERPRADHSSTSARRSEEDDADHAVDREERGVEAAQIARAARASARRRAVRRRPPLRASRRARPRARDPPPRAARPCRGGRARAPRKTPRSPKRIAHDCSPCSGRARDRRASRRSRSPRPTARPRRREPTPARAARP